MKTKRGNGKEEKHLHEPKFQRNLIYKKIWTIILYLFQKEILRK